MLHYKNLSSGVSHWTHKVSTNSGVKPGGQKRKATQAVKTTPHIDKGGKIHFGTGHRKTLLPADKKKQGGSACIHKTRITYKGPLNTHTHAHTHTHTQL